MRFNRLAGSLVVFMVGSVVLGAQAVGCVGDSTPPPIPPADAGGAPGAPRASLGGGAKVDFGLVDCGASAAPQTFTVTNTGTSALTYAVTIDNTAVFTIVGAASGSIEPGAKGSLTLGVATIAATSTAGTPLVGTLTVTTNDSLLPQARVALSVTPRGATLALTPSPVGFGQVNVQSVSPDLAVALKNTGNGPVTVGIGAPSDDEFAIAWTGAPAAATLAPGGSVAGLVSRFHPSSVGAKSGTAALTVTGAVCGASVASIALSGEGTVAPVTVAPSPIDFGATDCGTTAASKTITVTNGNAFAVAYTAALAQGTTRYTLSSASGSVAANGTATITITPNAITPPASVAADAFGDTLTITTDAPGDTAKVVPVTQSAHGAVLTASMATTSFGSVGIGASGQLPITLSNTGNGAVNVTLAVAAPFGTSPASPIALAAGSAPGATATFSPLVAGLAGGTLAFTASGGPVCSASLASIAVSGTGTASPLTVGTSPINVGPTSCATTAATQTMTLSNTNALPIGFSLSLGKGNASAYAFDALFKTSTTSGTVPANGTLDVSLYPRPISVPADLTAGAYNDQITLTTNAPVAGTQGISVTQSVVGAFLTATMAQTAFGAVSSGETASLPVSITNTGTMAANVTVSAAAPFSSSAISAPIGKTAVNVVFAPTSGATANGSVSFTPSGAPICSAPLAPIGVSGSVIYPTAGLPKNLALATTCGAAVTGGLVHITNTGAGDLIVTNLAVSGAFTLPSSVVPVIKTGAGFDVQVLPKAPVIGTDLGGTTDLGSLTFTTNEAGNPQRSVPLSRSVSGANLSYVASPTTIPYCTLNSSAGGSFTIQNTGDLATNLTLVADGGVSGGKGTFSPQQGGPTTVPLTGGGGTFGVFVSVASPFSTGPLFFPTPATFDAGVCIPLPPFEANMVQGTPQQCG